MVGKILLNEVLGNKRGSVIMYKLDCKIIKTILKRTAKSANSTQLIIKRTAEGQF